jgi:hypothetical protein
MIDLFADFFRVTPGRMAPLIDLPWRDRLKWADEEMESILRHQLSAPLDAELSRCFALPTNCLSNPRSFGDLLCDQQPRLDLLVGTKDFAIRQLRLGGRGLPRGVARVLYYASVLSALLCHGQRISRISDEKLRSGLEWAVEQRWLHPSLHELFRKGRVRLAVDSVHSR